MQHPIAFALDSRGRLVDVHSVLQGLACDCVCAGCGDRLLAKQGQVRAWYFSHLSGAECRGGAETALHLAAKQLILEHRSVALPPLVVKLSRQHPRFGLFERSKSIDLPDRVWRLSDARAEAAIGTYIADIAGTLDDMTEVIVEVKVHHEIEQEKTRYFRSSLLPCIEIDLYPLLKEPVDLQKLAWHVLECTTNRRWVSNSSHAVLEAQLLAEYNAWVASKSKPASDLSRRQYEVKKRPASKADEANARYRAQPDDMKRLELRMVFGLTGDNIWPRHLEVAVREGANAIPAPLDIWQGETFAQFIYDPTGQRGKAKRFSLPQVYDWFSGRFGTSDLVRYQVSAALRLFLGYLTTCGFLERHGEAFTVLHGALRPPPRSKSQACPSTSSETSSVAITKEPLMVRRGWTWRAVWPLEDVAAARAAEAAGRFACAAFDAQRFVRSLYAMSVEPSEAEVKRLVAECDGNANAAFDLLKDIGVVEESWRMLRAGVKAPWRRT